jgi:tetratricopeptide (TPR) repeat protein/nitrate/TMAO reductase-like tetraheme cytochrome c subunit
MPNPAKSTAVVIKRVVAVAVVVLLMLAAAVAADYWRSALPPDTVATYVGRASCVDCHQAEAAAFQGSHHDLAMDHANSQTVLGDFNDVTFEHHGIISRMYRDGDRYMIHTEGPDGKMADFEVEYVFGVEPLQQYMVEFDRDEKTPADALARLQVLRISWDTVRGRWFYLAPPDVEEKLAPDDDLHWTGIAQRWNTMCAECHSTDLQRNYDPQTQRYATTYSEIDVSCEACHGPGSTHVQLANSRSLFWDRNLGFGLAPLKGDDAELQIQACAPCHSRRGILAGGFQAGDAYCDFYEPSPLRQMLYHDDGQILDEVYVHGSFVQSKMYHKGIRCSDCHDPHSLKLKAPGNQVCTSCHQHPAGKYDTPSHHKHAPGKPGSACVDCHMPETTYMAVDPRRDHSLRIPRPDLSVSLGTPNACTGCHLDSANVAAELRDGLVDYAAWQLAAKQEPQIAAEISRVDAWCDQACDQWYGATRNREPHYAEALHAFRSGEKDGVQRLAELAAAAKSMPAIARATALDELANLPDLSQLATSTRAARQALEDPSPMVRAAAIRALAAERYRQDGQSRLAGTLGPSLADPSRLVRTTAARTLASTGAFRSLTPALEKKFESAIDEVKAGISQVADRAAAHLDWALLCESLGRVKEAVDAYKIAMQVEPGMVGPRSNLAGLLDNLLNAQQQAGQLSPQEAAATRETIATLRRQELPLIERDAKLAPDNAVLQYRLGMAYYLAGRMEEALASLQRSCQLEPENEDFATAVRLLKEKLDDP